MQQAPYIHSKPSHTKSVQTPTVNTKNSKLNSIRTCLVDDPALTGRKPESFAFGVTATVEVPTACVTLERGKIGSVSR